MPINEKGEFIREQKSPPRQAAANHSGNIATGSDDELSLDDWITIAKGLGALALLGLGIWVVFMLRGWIVMLLALWVVASLRDWLRS